MSLSKFLTFIAIFALFSSLNTVDFIFPIPNYYRGVIGESDISSNWNRELDGKLALQVNEGYESIIFVGDVMLARNVEYLMKTNDDTYPFKNIDFKTLSKRSVVVANFESSVPKIHIQTPSYKMKFSVDGKVLPLLNDLGFTHLSLANNHSFDYGQKNYGNTALELKNSGMIPFGHPTIHSTTTSVTYTEVGDKKVALIGLHTLEKTPTDEEIKKIFFEASNQSDFQIVYIHWGEEYKLRNNSTQKELATRLVSAGADLIVGHHPHVVQNIDYINNVPVFYSLGNFIFDQYFSSDTQKGMMIDFDLTEQLSIRIIPVSSIGTLSQPHIMKGSEYQAFLDDLADKSAPEIREYIAKGYLPLDSWVATSTKIAMME